LLASKGTVMQTPEKEIKASPIARRIAKQNGLDLSQIKGSGPGGRIVQADVESASNSERETTQVSALSNNVSTSGLPSKGASGTSVPVRGMRKTIASRMLNSLQTSAQLSMDMESHIGEVVNLRESLIREWQDEGIRPAYTDFIIKALAKALVNHPIMNSEFRSESIDLLDEINIGLAVALPEGLVVPVVRHANEMTVKEIAVESARLASAAKAGTLGLDDYAGGTFTVTALGMYGVDSFTPIINQPQTGILGVNRIYDGIEWNGDVPVRTKKMNLSLTWDHRVVDGAPAAEFLVEVCELLSQPYRLLI
jgi:pyruvate dehydrogenase E2 component (dihydrolipoamide acetyltransferase)